MLQPVAVIGALALSGGLQANQAADSLRLIVATGMVCHSLPDPGAPIAERYRLGDVIKASKSTKGPGGVWYFDAWRVKGISPSCWVPASSTVPFVNDHEAESFAAVVDRVLARDTASFETLVDAENLLVNPNPYTGMDRPPFAASALLEFKRLQLVDRATRLINSFVVADAPLKRAWVLSHRDILYFHDPSATWSIANDRFWAIYDANRGAPWAEELASYAGQRNPPWGDECDADCYLSMITSGPQQYWKRRPSGASIVKMLTIATQFADGAIKTIDEGAPTRLMIDSVRTSLAPVDAAEKQALLDRLARLGRAVKP